MAEMLKSLGFALIGDHALIDLDKSNFDNALVAANEGDAPTRQCFLPFCHGRAKSLLP